MELWRDCGNKGLGLRLRPGQSYLWDNVFLFDISWFSYVRLVINGISPLHFLSFCTSLMVLSVQKTSRLICFSEMSTVNGTWSICYLVIIDGESMYNAMQLLLFEPKLYLATNHADFVPYLSSPNSEGPLSKVIWRYRWLAP